MDHTKWAVVLGLAVLVGPVLLATLGRVQFDAISTTNLPQIGDTARSLLAHAKPVKMAKSKKNEAPVGAAPKKKTTPKQTKAASIVAVSSPPKARSTRRSRAACPSGVVIANKPGTADAPDAGDVEVEAALTAPASDRR